MPTSPRQRPVVPPAVAPEEAHVIKDNVNVAAVVALYEQKGTTPAAAASVLSMATATPNTRLSNAMDAIDSTVERVASPRGTAPDPQVWYARCIKLCCGDSWFECALH